MKKVHSRSFLALALAASPWATAQTHSPQAIEPASSLVSPAAVLDSMNQNIDLTRLSTKPGVHIVPLDESAFRGPLAIAIRQEIREQAVHGSYAPTTGGVPDLRTSLRTTRASSGTRIATLDRTYRTIKQARPHLRFEPASVAGTILEHADLRQVATGGEIAAGRWSGVTRLWEIPALGLVQLDESEFRETGGSITLVKEWLNATVGQFPATLKTMRTGAGSTLISVAWVTDTTSYRLDLQPTDSTEGRANEQALLALANAIGQP